MGNTHKIFTNKKSCKFERHLPNVFDGLKRADARHLIRLGIFEVNGRKENPNFLLKAGDVVEWDIKKLRDYMKKGRGGSTEWSELSIVYEDEDIVVIDKQPGMLVHPDENCKDQQSLLEIVNYHLVCNSPNPFSIARPLHRIDRVTSGIVILSKNSEIHRYLAGEFRKKNVEKTYLAIVSGDFKSTRRADEKVIVSNTISYKASNRAYTVVPEGLGRWAETVIEFLGYLGESNQYSLLKITPKTGRTHQIRVHLSYLGFPIVGDRVYGGCSSERVMLHSWKLVLNYQSTRKQFQSNIPNAFQFAGFEELSIK